MADDPTADQPETGTDADDSRATSWDQYWIGIAEAVKIRSDDEVKVGAVIVRENVLISTGYNGFAREVQHRELRLVKDAGNPEKLRWMCHAEQNAIHNAARVGVAVAGSIIYTTKFPCLMCTYGIIQSGISTIYTADTKPYDDALIGDDGRRVWQVLAETHVRLIAPNMSESLILEQLKGLG